MGSSNSKPNAMESSSPSSLASSSCGVRRSLSIGSRVFRSSCLSPSSGSHDSDNDEQVADDDSNERDCNDQRADQIKSGLDQIAECYCKDKAERADGTAYMSSNSEPDERCQPALRDTIHEAGTSSSRVFSSRSLSSSSRFLSRLSFSPGNVSFRLRKETSFSSSRANPISSRRSFTVPDEEEECHLHALSSRGMFKRNGSSRGQNLLPACLLNRSSPPHEDFVSSNIQSNHRTSEISDTNQEHQTTVPPSMARGMNNSRVEFDANLHSARPLTDIESMETRLPDSQIGARVTVEHNAHFSRTLSVGRLRDRVLCRPSFTDSTFSSLQQESEVTDASQFFEREALGGVTGVLTSSENVLNSSTSFAYDSSDISRSLYSNQDYDLETSPAREERYHDLFENRSNFLERRRRIRSQVRAFQRFGNRFGNLSGHERSCIISGQNRTGHCACRISTRRGTLNDDNSARASVSRIVMLAEALFEVLDEIHQQSVVLSSRPSVSSIGSVPAPDEIVESLPVVSYSKLQEHMSEETAQCYICLVEYEEGDSVRILPCHHEFHRTCIDKWLKEIHGVCPLCRGDICRTNSVPLEN